MIKPQSIIRAIVFLVIGVPFAILLVYFLHTEFSWSISGSATLVAVVVAILFGVLEQTLESSEPVSEGREKSVNELIYDIFGPQTDVELFEDPQAFAEKIQEEANDAVNSVDRIHFNMHYVNRVEDNLSDPSVQHRILLVKPIQENNRRTGELTGFQSVYNSNIDTNPSKDQFVERFKFISNSMDEGRWNSTKVKLYETTPWFRATIIDESRAGFLLLPSMHEGTKAAKFWTEDPNVVDTLESIYEDIWNDPRTEVFENWYDEERKLDELNI